MKFIKGLLILITIFDYLICQAQNHKCGSDYWNNQLMQNTNYKNKYDDYVKRLNQRDDQNSRTTATIDIPVAIHFGGDITSVNMCCLISASIAQIEVLNRDFNALNPDISLYADLSNNCSSLDFPISSLFSGLNINFYLTTSNHPSSSGLQDGEYAITVQQESWPYAGSEWAGYLNIFVDNIARPNPITGENAGGLSPVPGVLENNIGNGIWIYASQFGGYGINCSSGVNINSSSVFNLGRTAVHEVGHYFGLKHIFDGCNDGDGISDTPSQSVPNSGNPSYQILNGSCLTSSINSCGKKDFFMNYMDYSDDNSTVMFTQGQAIRMILNANLINWKTGVNSGNICNSNTCDMVIVQNEDFAFNGLIPGNIIVEANGNLHIFNRQLKFKQGKGIIVKNGGRLILQGSTIDACNPSQSWTGIKIESGGFFDTDNTFLKNVVNGVEAKTNSTLQINYLNIDGKGNTNGIGLKLDGNVNTDFIYNLDIKDFNIGIQTYSTNKVHEFNHGSINNTSFGISSVSSPIIVNDYNINYTNDAITMIGSAVSSIFDCDIIYRQQGIAITISPSTIVKNCSVSNNNWFNGVEYLNERPAIGIVLSDNCIISNNYPISSAANAVSAWGSSLATIDNNSISTNFSINGQLTGGPVNLQFGNSHIVTNNNITADQSEFGINSSWVGNTTIMNNTIYNSGFQKNFRTAAIKATGNLSESIHQNIVTGVLRTGVLVQNTTGNDYFCNEINSNENEAQDILYNSEQQFIKANTFDGGGYDLKIKSEIGLQATVNSTGNLSENNGNLFFGGNAEADPLVVFNSQFPYNLVNANHKPTNPNPSSGWFTQNTVVPYANCDGLIIGDNFIFGNDPTKICAYWSYLKSLRNTKPELFFVKLVHLLKYAKLKPDFLLPNCVKFDPVFQTLCGITKIVDVSVALANVSNSNINTSNLRTLQDQYNNERSDAGKSAIKDQMSIEMVLIKPQFDSELNADSLRLDSLHNELNTINCTSIILNKWKEILKLYVNFIKQGKVKNCDMAALESYSTECSDLYGEAIHLARAMANTYNRIYYDVNDGCLDASTPRNTEFKDDIQVKVSPNPTSGIINISFSEEYTGTINIFNSTGLKVFSQRVYKSQSNELDISNKASGIYLLQMFSDKGVSKEFKVILII